MYSSAYPRLLFCVLFCCNGGAPWRFVCLQRARHSLKPRSGWACLRTLPASTQCNTAARAGASASTAAPHMARGTSFPAAACLPRPTTPPRHCCAALPRHALFPAPLTAALPGWAVCLPPLPCRLQPATFPTATQHASSSFCEQGCCRAAGLAARITRWHRCLAASYSPRQWGHVLVWRHSCGLLPPPRYHASHCHYPHNA